MNKEDMINQLNDMLKDVKDSTDKDNVIRQYIILEVKKMVKNYEILSEKEKAFVDGFFKSGSKE